MERAYIQLSVINTITIVIMAFVGITVVGLISSGLQAYRGG
jgi:hypothetical protein